MKVRARIPCHDRSVVVNGGSHAGDTTMGDRQCPVCDHWWRFDTECLSNGDGVQVHEVTWTHIGLIAEVKHGAD